MTHVNPAVVAESSFAIMMGQQPPAAAAHNNSTHSTTSSSSNNIELTPDNNNNNVINNCHPPNVEADAVRTAQPSPRDAHHHHHDSKSETNAWDAWIQLTKAYIGPGCLSLPWAVSQLGLPAGIIVILIVAFWTSYNSWNVVALKRIILQERSVSGGGGGGVGSATNATTSNLEQQDSESHRQQQQHNQQEQQQLQQQHSHADHRHHIQVTYPDVGEWAYNRTFKDILLLSICVQQLAVCTVFLSFVGENIAAVMDRTLKAEGEKSPSHALVITLALPFSLILTCLPNLKVLSPVMLVATISLFTGFGLLGVVVGEEWEHRPRGDEVTFWDIDWSQVPMAFCAVLYSYEGICVILPVESAMAQPEHFQKVFVTSMSFTALVFSAVASLCVIAFGEVTNGSVTAFLVQTLQDENVKWWLYMANLFCSIAVLLTYPLQLFPCYELTGPWITRVLRLDIGTHGSAQHHRGGHAGHSRPEPPLRSFSPIPSHDNPDDGIVGNHEYHHHHAHPIPQPVTSPSNGNKCATTDGDEQQLVEEDDLSGEEIEFVNSLPFFGSFPTPGDSPQVRAILCITTYIMAIAIPNVQLLVSLAGALSGSATGLIIPPLLELAYVKRLEKEIMGRSRVPSSEPCDDEDDDVDDGNDRSMTGLAVSLSASSLSRLRYKKWECYLLFGFGVVVCVFGTGAALADIVRFYVGPPEP